MAPNELIHWRKTELTEEELNLLLNAARMAEDCILEGIPPHSGYKKAAKRTIGLIIYKLSQKLKDVK